MLLLFFSQHTALRCTALYKCALLVPPFPLTMASLCEKTPMGRKKKRLRNPPGPTLDTLRSFFKPAPISSHMKKGSNGTIPPSPQNERGDLVVLGL
mgnify:CR=1 FL=1